MRRILWLVAGAVLVVSAVLIGAPAPASAHPVNNLSINQYAALRLFPDRMEVATAVDFAELPTLQEKPAVEAEGPGYAVNACAELAAAFTVSVAGQSLSWTVTDQTFQYGPGVAGLATSRLDCRLVASAALDRPTTVEVTNRFHDDRVGWRELTATGDGVRLVDSPVPVRSISDGLRAYPPDLLSSPLDVRAAVLRVEPGDGTSSSAEPAHGSGGWSLTGLTAAGERALDRLVGDRLTPLVGGLAVLLALALGAGHAALPGHGKTVMAAYLAGRRGRPRDAIAVGAMVTLTHTGGVLVLGLLLTGVAGLAGESVLGWLGLSSGALVVAIGVSMLLSRRRHHHHHHDHDHDHHHDRPSRLGIAGIGLAGGLVPSPSALVVLLGAIGLGRTWFGVLLVVAYGLGMAGTLTAAGLLLIRLRERWAGRARILRSVIVHRLAHAAPTATAGLVLLVGIGVAGRAVAALA